MSQNKSCKLRDILEYLGISWLSAGYPGISWDIPGYPSLICVTKTYMCITKTYINHVITILFWDIPHFDENKNSKLGCPKLSWDNLIFVKIT